MSNIKNICNVDCRIDEDLSNDFLTLRIWGKLVYQYAIDIVISAEIFDEIYVVTNSPKIRKQVEITEDIMVVESPIIQEEHANICFFSGRAIFVRKETLRKAYKQFNGGILTTAYKREQINFFDPIKKISFFGDFKTSPLNAFAFYEINRNEINVSSFKIVTLEEKEAVVINNTNDFELAIILKKKDNNALILADTIKQRIEEKKEILGAEIKHPSICLVGHSQVDYWEDNIIGGFHVQNCGIAGISSFGYAEFILDKGLLNCSADWYLIMHGTNDIVLDRNIDEICESIWKTVKFIQDNAKHPKIFFVSCIHINGRLDRNNRRIDEMNVYLKEKLKDAVIWIDTSFMNDEFNDLEADYTVDGLHLSKKGYTVLKKHIEEFLRKEYLNG